MADHTKQSGPAKSCAQDRSEPEDSSRGDGRSIANLLEQRPSADSQPVMVEALTAVELAMEGIAKLDDAGRYVFVNQQYAALLGYGPDELVGQSWETTVCQDDRPSVRAGIDRMLEIGRAEAELRGVKKDGSFIYNHVVLVKQDGSGKRIPGHLWFVWDVTERKRIEALQDAEKQALELVAKGESLESVLRCICQAVEHLASPMRCSVMLADDDELHLVLATAPNLPGDYNQAIKRVPIGPMIGSCGSAAYFRRPAIAADIATDPLWKDYASVALTHGLKACWSLPIMSAANGLLGTLAVYHDEPREPRSTDLELLERISQTAAIAIEHAHMMGAMKESQERFQAAVQGANEGIWDWNLATNEAYFSPRWKAMLGYEDHEISHTYQEWESRLHPEDRERVLSHLSDSLEGRTVRYDVEFRLRKKDGVYCWINACGIVIRDAASRPIRMAGSHTDVTERKREEALRIAEKQTLELVAQGILLNEVLTFMCHAIESVTEPMLCSVMLVSEDQTALVFSAGPSLPEEYIGLLTSIPIGPAVGSCGTAAYHGTPIIAEDITIHPLWESCAHVALQHGLRACWSQPIKGSTGRVLGTFAAYYREPRAPQQADLRLLERVSSMAALAIEHASMLEAIKESEARFDAFMNHSPAVTFIKDGAGRYVYVSPQFETLACLSKQEAESRTVFDFLPAHIATRLSENDTTVLASGQTLESEESLPDPDGTVRDWLTIKFPLEVRQRPLLGGIAVDITDRKEAEAKLLRTQFAMDQAVDAVYWIDPQARILYTNAAASAMLGYTTDEFLRMTVHDLNPDFPAEVWPGFWAETREKKVVSLETIHLTKDRRRIPIDIRVSFLAYGGQEFHCAFVRDISKRKQAEEAAHRSFTLLQSVLHTTPIRVFWKDRESRFLGCNQSFALDAGCTDSQEIVGKTDDDLIWHKQAALYQADDRLVMESGLPKLDFEEPGTTLEGKSIWLRTSKVPLRNERGHVIGVLGVYEDITERKRMDRALRESQERFELAVSATYDGIWDWNILTGEQYWSDHHLELFGLRPGDITPTYDLWLSLVHPDDVELVRQATCRHLETRAPYDLEVRVRMKDGSYRWFRDRGQAVWDASGRPVRMVGSISDVTERRRAEETIWKANAELEQRVTERTKELAAANRALERQIIHRKQAEDAIRESELRYKLVTEATFDAIALHDSGILIEVNTGLERMFGYDSGELLGRSILDLIAEESRDHVLLNMDTGVTGPYEAVGRRKDGTTFPGELVVRPYRYRGKEVRLVAGRDITVRKQLELQLARHAEELVRQVAERTSEIAKLEAQRAQTEKLAAVGQMAAAVAHEINNPIAGIRNAFSLVKQAVDPAHPHYEFVGMIDREITRVASIVQNMYQLYRKEPRKAEPVNLSLLLRDLESLFAKRLSQLGLTLAVTQAPLKSMLLVPQSDLLQVLMNLVQNALDSSREGGTITLNVHQDADMVRISVSDEGSGIPPDVLPHIFDPFFTTKTGKGQKGMGLGLSVSQSLVMAMGGRMEVQTEQGAGSTFSIILPEPAAGSQTSGHRNIMQEVVTYET